ncbi:MAG: tRNA-dihydrouridine synthase, partial [Halanaerobiales bacterium]
MSNSELTIEFCGKKCENPFFLASAPVTNNYKMVARALERGWGGLVFKTIGLFIANEVSPRFDQLKKENTSFLGFRNLEQTSEYPLEQNLENMKKIKKNYPDKILIASILGRNKKEWTKLAKMVTEVGVDMIECNFSCPQMEDNGLGSDVGQNPELVNSYIKATLKGTELPVIAKMTPNLEHMVPPAVAAVKG